MAKPTFSLPVIMDARTTKRLLDDEVNRYGGLIWDGTIVAASDPALAQQVRDDVAQSAADAQQSAADAALYDGPRFDTVTDFFASTDTFTANTYVRTDAEGFAYKAVNTATASTVANAGGQNFEVLDAQDGSVTTLQYGPTLDGVADDNAALVGAMGHSFTRIAKGTHLSKSAIVVQNTLHQMYGAGWRLNTIRTFDSGSALKGDATVVDLLTIEPNPNDGTNATEVHGLRLQDFAVVHEGTGTALKVDHIVYPILDRLSIDGGAIGVELNNWSFFADVRNCRISRFTDTGLFISGPGSQNAVTNSSIGSPGATGADVKYAIRAQSEGTLIQGGQMNANRTDDTGIGVWFDNPFASGVQNYGKGGARGVLVEADIGFKIGTAGNSRWDNVILEDIRSDFGIGISLLAQFTNTYGSQLFLPRIDRPDGGAVCAKWDGAEARNCGVVLDALLYNVPFDVNAAAVDPWVHFVGTMTTTQRDLIHADTNLKVTVDNVIDTVDTVNLGVSKRINGVWNKDLITIADDAAASFSVPSNQGQLSITNVSTGGVAGAKNALLWYQTASFGEIAEIFSGTDVTINAQGSALTGTAGVDGNLTIQYVRAEEKIYVENRTGAAITLLWHAYNLAPDNA